jgi:hypothetical protein
MISPEPQEQTIEVVVEQIDLTIALLLETINKV